MLRKLSVASTLLLLAGASTVHAQDARAVLRAAVVAMGADKVKTIQYSGTGWNAAVGQSYSPQDDWPRFEVTRCAHHRLRCEFVAGRTDAAARRQPPAW